MQTVKDTRQGSLWTVDVDHERIGKAGRGWSFQKVDGRWRSFDGRGFEPGLAVRVSVKIMLDGMLAEAKRRESIPA